MNERPNGRLQRQRRWGQCYFAHRPACWHAARPSSGAAAVRWKPLLGRPDALTEIRCWITPAPNQHTFRCIDESRPQTDPSTTRFIPTYTLSASATTGRPCCPRGLLYTSQIVYQSCCSTVKVVRPLSGSLIECSLEMRLFQTLSVREVHA